MPITLGSDDERSDRLESLEMQSQTETVMIRNSNGSYSPVVLTKGLESLFTKEQIDDVVTRTPFREPTRPADVAAVVEFLASDDARLITGKLWEI